MSLKSPIYIGFYELFILGGGGGVKSTALFGSLPQEDQAG
jgi:hypothetical protein